jgi:hypothetical protein
MNAHPAIANPTAPLVVHVAGVGLRGPGLPGWGVGKAALRSAGAWQSTPTEVGQPALLPPTERRRAGAVVRASVTVADEACIAAGVDAASLATVFAASSGEPVNCHLICESLAGAQRLVSPTRFTNSVHNVAAGYWHIATHSMHASTSVAGFEASFASGLLEAAAQCVHAQAPVLLVAYDTPYPEPLNALRTVPDVFALALVLMPGGVGQAIALSLHDDAPPTRCADAGLEALRAAIPSARALPLLQLLASRAPGRCVIEGPPGLSITVDVGAAP